MKQIALIVTSVLCGAAFVSSIGSVRANGQLDQILANMQQAGKNVNTMQANLAYHKRNTDLGGAGERNTGWMKFKRAGRNRDLLRVKYNNGVEALVDAGWGYLYQPDIKQVTKRPRSSLSGANESLSFLEIPYKSIEELKSQYNIVYRGEESIGSKSTSVVELTPRPEARGRKLVLWVDHSSWLPVQYENTERSSKITFTLSDIKTNVEFGKDVFKLNPPAGTKFVTP
jgi:outer membrane lipoprotein-sorting protein